MILGWVNRIDTAALSAPEVATLPASNIKHPHLSRKWHTPAGTTTAALVADMGTPLTCSLLAVLGANLTPTAVWRLRGSDSDSTGETAEKYDSGSTLAGFKPGYGAAYKPFSSAQARYWRLDLEDPSLPSNIQIGRVYLGPSWRPIVNHALGWGVTPLDDSSVSQSYGRQTYIDARPQRRILQFALEFMSEAEAFGNAFALARANGITKDVLAIPDENSAFVSEQSVWGPLTQSEPVQEPRLGLWRQRFTIMERL